MKKVWFKMSFSPVPPLLLVVLLVLVSCSSKSVKKTVLEIRQSEGKVKTSKLAEPSKDDMISNLAFRYFVDGTLYEGLEDYNSAARKYTKALQIYPTSHEIRYSLASVLFRMKMYGDVIETLEFIKPEDLLVHELRAASFRMLGDREKSKISYLKVIEHNDRHTMAYSYLSSFYRAEKKIDSVIWCYENMTIIRNNNYRLFNDLAKLYRISGDYLKYEKSLKKSLELNNRAENLMAFVELGELYDHIGKGDSAIATYLTGLKVDGNDIVLNRLAANYYMEQDSVYQAIKYAERIVEISPMDKPAVRLLGTIYFRADSLKKAAGIFERLISIGDRHPIDFYYMGRISVLNENFESAREHFTSLTKVADTLAQSWLDLGFACRKLEEKDDEINTYKTGLTHMQNEASGVRLLFALAATYEYYDEIDMSIEVFEELIAKVPDHSQALNYLGYMLTENDMRLDDAILLIERALEISPENAAFLDSYGWVHYKMKNYKKAIKYLKKAVASGNDPVIHDHLGDAFKAVGDNDKASEWWQKALELNPKDSTIMEKIGN